jgi:hypothetical protein
MKLALSPLRWRQTIVRVIFPFLISSLRAPEQFLSRIRELFGSSGRGCPGAGVQGIYCPIVDPSWVKPKSCTGVEATYRIFLFRKNLKGGFDFRQCMASTLDIEVHLTVENIVNYLRYTRSNELQLHKPG